jgi:hypothetical protein
MGKFYWLRPSRILVMFAAYTAFAVLAGLVTFFALWADKSPGGILAFATGMVSGVVAYGVGRIIYEKRIIDRAVGVLLHPFLTPQSWF